MARARLELNGLEDLKAALRQLPAELTDDATAIVQATAEDAASALRQAYPVGETSNLRNGVRVVSRSGVFTTTYRVKSMAPHAHLWEYGTENRVTRKGWRRGKGPSHEKEGLTSIAPRYRKRMNQQLMDLVRKNGLLVSGAL